MTQTCTAAVFKSLSEPLSLESWPLAEPKPGEVRLAIECCTICGSDLHSLRGRRTCSAGTVLGHEVVGRIEGFGGEFPLDLLGQPLTVGDRVIFSLTVACGHCRRCRDGFPQKCLNLFKYGHEPAGGVIRGGVASHVTLRPGTGILKVNDTLPAELLAALGCAGATVMAVIRKAGQLQGKRVLVIGLGMLGAMACAVAANRGATVLAVDVSQERLRFSEKVGASHTVMPDELPSALRSHFEGGADVALEMSGQIDAVRAAVQSLDVGGRCVLAGSVFPTDPLELHPESLIRGLHELVGVHNYLPEDLVTAKEFFESSEFTAAATEKMVSFPLTQIDAALAAAESGKYLRVAVRP